MTLKRATWPEGELLVLEHDSQILRDNPLGDPHVRKHHVWLPPQYSSSGNKRFPVLYDLVGYTGSGLSHTAWRNFDENVPERAARLIHARRMAPAILVFPRLLYRAGRKPVHQFQRHRQLRGLPHPGNHPVYRRRTAHPRQPGHPWLFRQILRRLRRYRARHEVPQVLGCRGRSLRRCLLRLRVPRRLAQHPERAGEVPPTGAQGRAHRCRQGHRRSSKPGLDDGRVKRFLGRLLGKGEARGQGGHVPDEPGHGRQLRSRPGRTQRLQAALQPGDGRIDSRALEALAGARPDPHGQKVPRQPDEPCAASSSIAAGATSTTSTTAPGCCRGSWPGTGSTMSTRNSTIPTRASTTAWSAACPF